MDKENSVPQKQPLANTNNNTLCQTPTGTVKIQKSDNLLAAVED